MNFNNEILVSLLTHNSKNHIKDCLNSLQNQTNKNFKCFIFDNLSTDGIEEEIKNYQNVVFIATGGNLGYTGGHNFSLNYFKKNFTNHRYMMVLNPDAILSQNLIEEYFKIFNEENFLYSCIVKENENTENIYVGKNIHLPSFSFMGSKLPTQEQDKDVINNPFVTGCCFIVDFQKLNNEDLFKDYFMYHDEIELSIRTRLKGYKIPTLTNGYVIHNVKKDISKLPDRTIYLLEFNRLRLQSDLFNDLVIFINLPFYLLSRLSILFLLKPKYMYKPYLLGIFEGLKYWIKNFDLKKKSFLKTIRFLLIENYFHKY